MRTRFPGAAATLLLAAAIPAQTASFSTFGQTCRNDLQMVAVNLPRLGQAFTLRYTGPYDPSFVGSRSFRYQPFLVLGGSDTVYGGRSLPFPLPASLTGGANCQVLVSLDVTIPLPVIRNQPPALRTLSLQVPNNPQLIGSTFYVQWFVFTQITDPTGVTGTLHSSDGGRGVIGT